LLKVSDGRNFGRTLTGLCLIGGPLLFLIAVIVQPNVDDSDKVKELANVAANESSFVTAGIVFFLGSLVLMGAGIGVIHLFRSRGLGLGQVAGALLTLGSAATIGWYALGAVEYEMVNQSGLDRAQMAQLLDKSYEANSLAPILIVFAVGIVLGTILLAVAAWRRRLVPVWAAVAIAVAGLLSFGGESKGVSIVSFVILLVGLGKLGVTVLGMTDEEWDAPRDAPRPDEALAEAAV